MPAEELEHELRSVFARTAAASYHHQELARQRLLRRNYRPGSDPRRLAAGLTAAGAAGAVVLGLGLSGAPGSTPARTGGLGSGHARGTGTSGSGGARGTGAIRTASFTLTRSANGTVTLTISPRVLLNARTLQNDLARYGIPAKVTTGSFCSTDPAPAGLPQVLTSSPSTSGGSSRIITINPAAMPAGTELSFGSFQVATGQETVFTLIDTGSYSCTSTMPADGEGGVSGVVHGGRGGK